MQVRFGVRIPFTGPVCSSERLRAAAMTAESLGFDAVFAQDHIHKTFERHPQNPMASGSIHHPESTREPVMLETLTSMAFLAGVTERIELVTAVTPVPLRDPIILAKQLATVDAHSNGRLVFGVGVANKTDRDEFTAMNVPFRTYSERYALAGEYIEAARQIWEEPAATYHGRYVNFDNLVIYPKPLRRIPVWVGAASLSGGPDRPPVRFALDSCDGVMLHAIASPDEVAQSVADFTTTATAYGRKLDGFTWCAQRRVGIGRTMEDAERHVAWMKEEQVEMWKYVGHLFDRGGEGTDLSHRMAVVGTPEHVISNLQSYVTAGATYIGIAFTYASFESLLEQMEIFSREVIPAFR